MGNCQSNCFGNYCGQGGYGVGGGGGGGGYGKRQCFKCFFIPRSQVNCSQPPPCFNYNNQCNNYIQPCPMPQRCLPPQRQPCSYPMINNNNNNNNQFKMSHSSPSMPYHHFQPKPNFPQMQPMFPVQPMQPMLESSAVAAPPLNGMSPQLLENLNLNPGEFNIFLRLMEQNNNGNYFNNHGLNGGYGNVDMMSNENMNYDMMGGFSSFPAEYHHHHHHHCHENENLYGHDFNVHRFGGGLLEYDGGHDDGDLFVAGHGIGPIGNDFQYPCQYGQGYGEDLNEGGVYNINVGDLFGGGGGGGGGGGISEEFSDHMNRSYDGLSNGFDFNHSNHGMSFDSRGF
jgi:hypothetical protein